MDGETVERGRSRIDYFRGDAKKYPAWVYDCRLWAIDHDSDDVYDDLDNPFARPRREEYEEVDVPPSIFHEDGEDVSAARHSTSASECSW